jgi:hypothetical protein
MPGSLRQWGRRFVPDGVCTLLVADLVVAASWWDTPPLLSFTRTIRSSMWL